MATTDETHLTLLSDAELAVIRAMRTSTDHGDAIYRYALGYDDYGRLPERETPYEYDAAVYEEVWNPLPADLLVLD